jgi:very-short-patch-repair endonuclease
LVTFSKSKEFRFCSRKCRGVDLAKQMAESKGPTSIEIAIMNELDNREISYKPQYIIAVWIVDIAIPEYRLAIECDGDYWHSSETQKEKDANKDHWLNAHKWTIFRFTETEIKKSASDCVDKIIRYIQSLS